MQTINVKLEDLPQIVLIERSDGKKKAYQLKPAGKDKFGACLAGLESPLLEKIVLDEKK